jgi:hypothetical protein
VKFQNDFTSLCALQHPQYPHSQQPQLLPHPQRQFKTLVDGIKEISQSILGYLEQFHTCYGL